MINIGDEKVVVHYELNDSNSHVINAHEEANSSLAFVKGVNYVSSVLGIESELETGSLEHGSIIKMFKFSVISDAESEYLRYIILVIFYKLFFEKVAVKMEDFYENQEDETIEELKRVFKKYRITDNILLKINNHNGMKVARSNYFGSLFKCKSIKQLDIDICNNQQKGDYNIIISAEKFSTYIENLQSETKTIDEAKLYIISPVILKGNKIRWAGTFKDENINFDMLSNDFKNQAQAGIIVFSTGFWINCKLQYDEKIDEENNLKKNNYKVIEVYGHGIDNDYTPIKAGKKKNGDEPDVKQFDLFEGMDTH